MIVLETLKTAPRSPSPRGLAIGNFDGVHMGHQHLISYLRSELGPHGTLAVVTFQNHPSHLFCPDSPTPLLQSPPLKLQALEKLGVDIVYCLPFTAELASKTYNEFLEDLMAVFPFDTLVFGEGATFGKNREGTQENVTRACKLHNIHVHYLSKKKKGHDRISSQLIRKAIREGDLKTAESLLTRPYALMVDTSSEIVVVPKTLLLPPSGTYKITFSDHSEPQLIQIEKRIIRFLQRPPKNQSTIFFT